MVAEAHVQFLIQRASGRGFVLVQVRKDALRIGRGTNAELRSENPAVALEHAIIEMEAGGYVITDKGSITGTYVNRKPVESARLAKGDIIEVGDLRIDVQLVEPGKPLFLRVVPTEVRSNEAGDGQEEDATIAPATPGRAAVRAKKVDYVSAYRLSRPWLTKLTLTALGLIVTLGVIGEVIRPEKQKAFMPGGLSSAHSRARDTAGNVVAEECSACHTPWKSVENAKCLACHARPPHAMSELNPPDCFQCHAEHRGEMTLAANADERCTGCHADLTKHVPSPGASRHPLPVEGRGKIACRRRALPTVGTPPHRRKMWVRIRSCRRTPYSVRRWTCARVIPSALNWEKVAKGRMRGGVSAAVATRLRTSRRFPRSGTRIPSSFRRRTSTTSASITNCISLRAASSMRPDAARNCSASTATTS